MKRRRGSKVSTFLLAGAVSTATVVAGICAAVWLTGHGNPNVANQSSTADNDRTKPPKLLSLAPTLQRMGQAVALGVAVHDLGDGGLAVVHGLANGATLSIGKRLSSGDWWLSAIDLSAAKIEPPQNFVGVMDVSIELRLPNTELVDSQTLHFTWQQPAVSAETSVNDAEPRVTHAEPGVTHAETRVTHAEPGVTHAEPRITNAEPRITNADPRANNAEPRANNPVSSSSPVISRPVPARHLSPEDVVASLKRGEELIANGDLGAARLVFQRLAEDGNADAALALAKIYDPMMPEKQRAHGFASDAALAQYWYERARALGSNDARRRLQFARHSGEVIETMDDETPMFNGH
jgi:hypothetical protein